MICAFHLCKPFFTAFSHPRANNCERAPYGGLLAQVPPNRALTQLHVQIASNMGMQLY
jgi:hypothetical protein